MSQFPPIQDAHAQTSPRQIERNRSADDPAADNHGVVCIHANILSVCSVCRSKVRQPMLTGCGVPQYFAFGSPGSANVPD